MVVGSGAQVLGPLIVGAGARIGSNAVVLKDVSKGATMVGIAARPATGVPKGNEAQSGFAAYGTPSPNVADPMSRSIEGLLEELDRLRARVGQLENESAEENSQSAAGKESDEAKGDVSPPNC